MVEILKLANEVVFPVTARGGGVGYTGGAVPVDGGIVIGTDRMKRIACMDTPLIVAYDENAMVRLPGTSELNAFAACEMFQKNRQMTATILRNLPTAAWERFGIHTESGKVTLGELLVKYTQHLDHHLKFIAAKRARLEGTASIEPTSDAG